MRRITTTVLLLTLVIAPLAGCGWRNWAKAERTESRNLDHVPGAAVHVQTRNGRVEIYSAPQQADVTIEATLVARADTQEAADLRLAEASIEVVRDDDDRLVVRPVFPDPVHGGDGANFKIHLPDAHGVQVETGNGSVYLAGLSGDLFVDTSNGRIEVDDHDGPARVATSNGSILFNHHAGAVHANTSNGSIRLHEINGSVDAGTSNGSVDVMLAGDRSGSLNVRTSNGGVSVRVGPEFAGRVTFGTSNGRITVRDPNGRITSMDLEKTRGDIVVGEGGEGGEPSRIGTSNGGIRFTIAG